MIASVRLRNNIIANFTGRGIAIILAIVFTPFYIHFLGIEAYGLIGFYITLQGTISFLEIGLSRACNRELARYSGKVDFYYLEMLDTLRSLEIIYWIIAISIGVVMTLSASWIASEWLNSSLYTNAELKKILLLIGWVIALRWPVGLYSGAMMGLQRHVLMNITLAIISLLNWGGSVLVLWLLNPDIVTFFQWQLVVALAGSIIFTILTWSIMPESWFKARVSLYRIKEIMPYAVGVGSNAIIGTTLNQADKLILSAMLPLKQFSIYALAALIANSLSLLSSSIASTVFPRFSQMLGKSVGTFAISELYHLSCQAVSFLIIPFALLVAFFSYEILYVYTGDTEIAEQTKLLLPILIIAKMLHAEMHIPFALQLAYGWIRLSLYINIVSILWLLPSIYILSGNFGSIGAAFAWLIVTLGYVLIGMPLMHRKILKGEVMRWYVYNLFAPIVFIFIYFIIIKFLWSDIQEVRILVGCYLLLIGIGALLISLFSAKKIREWLLNVFKERLSNYRKYYDSKI